MNMMQYKQKVFFPIEKSCLHWNRTCNCTCETSTLFSFFFLNTYFFPQEMAALRNQVNSCAVNVEVDARPQEDMSRTIDEIRRQYEAITEKNRRDMDNWYKTKVRRAR